MRHEIRICGFCRQVFQFWNRQHLHLRIFLGLKDNGGYRNWNGVSKKKRAMEDKRINYEHSRKVNSSFFFFSSYLLANLSLIVKVSSSSLTSNRSLAGMMLGFFIVNVFVCEREDSRFFFHIKQRVHSDALRASRPLLTISN